MSLSDSSLTASSIPKITELREHLGYGDPQVQRCRAFYDDVTAFRRKHRTSSGLSGADLVDWKSSEHQHALDDMVDIFLEDEHNGHHYWPTHNEYLDYYSPLQYSHDRPLIKGLMKKLIFRLNQQQFRNAKYKKRTPTPAYIHSEFDSGHKNADEMSSQEAVSIPVAQMLPRYREELSVATAVTKKTHKSSEKSKSRTAQSTSATTPQKKISKPVDIYEKSSSPEPSHFGKQHRITKLQFVTDENKLAFAHTATTTKHRQGEEAESLQKPTAKRQKLQLLSAQASKDKISSKQVDAAYNTRISPRVRKSVHRPELATEEEIMNAVGLQSSSPSPTNQDNALSNTVLKGRSEGPKPLPSMNLPTSPDRPRESITSNHQCNSILHDPPLDSTTSSAQSHNHPNTTGASSTTASPPILPPSALPTTTTQPPKPNLKFIYYLILCRHPNYQEKTWHPSGKFLEKSLSVLLAELPFPRPLKGLEFCLAGPGISIEAQIEWNDEAAFEAMKMRWNRQIRSCIANHKDGERALVMNIEIGVLEGEGMTGGSGRDEVEALDW